MSNREDKYGEKIQYDPLWKGPMQNIRFPTDRIWLINFVVYVIIYISGAMYGFIAGDINKLGSPTDYVGRSCGIDVEVKDKPYLLYIDLKDCLHNNQCTSPSVCVSQCPTVNYFYEGSKTGSIDKVKEKLICTSDINVTLISSFDQIDKLVDLKKCAKWYLESKPVANKCMAFNSWTGHENDTINSDELAKARKAIENAENTVNKIYNDTKTAIKPAIVAIICGGILALIYVVLLKWFAVPFFYASIVMFCSFMVYGIYKSSYLYANSEEGGGSNFLFILIVSIFLIVSLIIAAIHFRKKIYLACLLVKESSKAVMHLATTLIFPILPVLLYVLVVVFTIAAFMCLTTITKSNYAIEITPNSTGLENCVCESNMIKPVTGDTCDPIIFNSKCKVENSKPCLFTQCRLKSKTNPSYVYLLHSINFFGFYWLMFFISGFEYMVLAGAFASWYWTFNKNNVGNYALIESATRTVRYHLGTVALGSLILTIVQIIRFFLQALQNKARESQSGFAQCVMWCMRCIFDILDALINFVSYNAYIMCAIHGKNFCQSARSAFNLIMRNVVKIIVVDTVADWLFVMAKLLVTSIAVGGVMLYYNMTQKEDGYIDDSMGMSLIITGIGTFIIASVFFQVQSIAVSTIFLCFVEDTERNDGSEERPYYMSNQLKKLLCKEL